MGKISFLVSGYVDQEIEILDKNLTIEDIVKGLNNGKYMTTLHEQKNIVVVETDEVVANIISTENNCEYTEFEIVE